MPTLGANVAILDALDRVLLIEREDFRVWGLPGGTVEPGESVARTAMREAQEETGLEVALTRLVGVYSLPEWVDGGNHTVLFAARPVGGVLMEGVDGEAREARYYRPDRLPENLLWWHRRRIVDALGGTGGSVAWSQGAASPRGTPRQEIYAMRDREELEAEVLTSLVRHPGSGHEVREA
jgi:ADP-ribose pyrophosphatase YjhB (NUDIX family)